MRLERLPPAMAKRLAELECPDFQTTPWVEGQPLKERRVAIVSSAGLVVRGGKLARAILAYSRPSLVSKVYTRADGYHSESVCFQQRSLGRIFARSGMKLCKSC